MNSRQKGARGERELAGILKNYGYEARRGQQYSGANGDADVVGLDGIHIECKRVERLDLYGAMAQSVRDARNRETPVVMHRKDRSEWLVTLRIDDFMRLYGESRTEWKKCDTEPPRECEEVIVKYKYRSTDNALLDMYCISALMPDGTWLSFKNKSAEEQPTEWHKIPLF